MGPRRFTRSEFRLAILAAMCFAGPAAAQDLLDRVQGLYYPEGHAGWDCTTLGMDGGAVGVRGQTLEGVENSCALENPFPIPGMDAIAFDLACTGEGMTYDGGRVILLPIPNGLAIVGQDGVRTWLRCR
jgi:hypothetical protein